MLFSDVEEAVTEIELMSLCTSSEKPKAKLLNLICCHSFGVFFPKWVPAGLLLTA